MASGDVQLVKNTLHDIATHGYALAMGLQNAAPPLEGAKPMNTVQYLLDIAKQLEQVNRAIEDWFSARA